MLRSFKNKTFAKSPFLVIPRKATTYDFSLALNINSCVALDAHCLPKKAQFITFRGITTEGL